MMKVYYVNRTWDWGDYGSGSQVMQGFLEKIDAEKYADKMNRADEKSVYRDEYTVEEMDIK